MQINDVQRRRKTVRFAQIQFTCIITGSMEITTGIFCVDAREGDKKNWFKNRDNLKLSPGRLFPLPRKPLPEIISRQFGKARTVWFIQFDRSELGAALKNLRMGKVGINPNCIQIGKIFRDFIGVFQLGTLPNHQSHHGFTLGGQGLKAGNIQIEQINSI